MSLYRTTSYTVGSLLTYLDNGDIGLPDLQRPFVWKKVKVRELFDSLYKGYPVGFFLFWDLIQTAQEDNKNHTHQIGIGNRHHEPQRVVIDGQQRLTSLYAVIKGEKVKDESGNWIKIKLAFNPMTGSIEVSNVAHERSIEWIANITEIWTKDINDSLEQNNENYSSQNDLWSGDIFSIVEEYLGRFENNPNYSLTIEQKNEIKNNIRRIQDIEKAEFTALEIASSVGIEQVSDIFVRINSEGKKLKQADFILTLLSVYWEEGRKEIESFSDNRGNPFNYLFTPLPDDIIKVLVSFTFYKGILKDTYNLLRGRNTETRTFDPELRIQRLELLKNNLTYVLDPTNWASFFKILIGIGFKSERLINSNNTLLFTFIIFLIGKYKFRLEYNLLEKYIGKYYIFTILSAKYSSSTESTLEDELKKIELINSKEGFMQYIDEQINVKIGEDFWNKELIEDINSSYIKNNSYMTYLASKIYFNTKVLFSNNLFGDLINDEITFKKELIDKHHIFPVNYLNTNNGIDDIKITNQVANIVYLGYNDNIKISDKSPTEYYLEMVERYGKDKVKKGLIDNDIPLNFYELSYEDFLVDRRKLMIESIKKYFQAVVSGEDTPKTEDIDINSLIEFGESNTIEFKSSLRWDIKEGLLNKKLEFNITKTISAFLNSNGGTLLIGVEDNGNIFGIESDYSSLNKKNFDGFLQEIDNLIDNTLGKEIHRYIKTSKENIGGKDIAIIKVEKCNKPVFVIFEGKELFFIRAGSSSRPLSHSEAVEFVKSNW